MKAFEQGEDSLFLPPPDVLSKKLSAVAFPLFETVILEEVVCYSVGRLLTDDSILENENKFQVPFYNQ